MNSIIKTRLISRQALERTVPDDFLFFMQDALCAIVRSKIQLSNVRQELLKTSSAYQQLSCRIGYGRNTVLLSGMMPIN